ncbi:Ff.00g135370.m01.CDS01 [Fusarium sp. VM40]|nr:Ff.00g135370.m01.CDS01 [Fusarium sp. VM40]
MQSSLDPPSAECVVYVAPFQHAPLDSAAREIRLLTLLPGEPGSPLVGNLKTVSLNDKPQYEALSYTWGSSDVKYDMTIDGLGLSVGHNLRKALDDLRSLTESCVIWNDAICINQSDHEEKGHQIHLMRAIYSESTAVCAWIDHEINPLDPSFMSLQALDNGVQIQDYSAEYWHPVARIFRNQYWRRLWVQQELIMAPTIHDVLAAKCYHARERHSTRADRIARGEKPRSRWSELMTWFLDAIELEMSEPRDRVYGILGITLRDEGLESFDINYNLPVATVYSQVFEFYIRETNSLLFLCFFQLPNRPPTTGPKVAVPTRMPTEYLMLMTSLAASDACGPTLAVNARICLETLVLSVEGHCLDSISCVLDINTDEKPLLSEWLSQLEDFCRRIWPNDTTEPLYEKDEVNSLFFPWMHPQGYVAMWGHERPSYELRLALIRALVQERQLRIPVDKSVMASVQTFNSTSGNRQIMYDSWSGNVGSKSFLGTTGGRIGTIRSSTGIREGDELWIVFGCWMPLVLRPVVGKSRRYTLVGASEFHGIMLGEGVLYDGPSVKPGVMVELE